MAGDFMSEQNRVGPLDTHLGIGNHNGSSAIQNPYEAKVNKLSAVIILAGGTGERLGGVSKPDVVIAGKRLLDHCLDSFDGTTSIVVVAPCEVAVANGIGRVQEHPPLSGPAAGVIAGWDYLQQCRSFEPDDLVGIMPVDAPLAGYALQQMAQDIGTEEVSVSGWGEAAVDPATSVSADKTDTNIGDTDLADTNLSGLNAVASNTSASNTDIAKLPIAARAIADGIIQQCIAVLPAQALSQATKDNANNMSMRRLWNRIEFHDVEIDAELACDVDCPEDLATVGALLASKFDS